MRAKIILFIFLIPLTFSAQTKKKKYPVKRKQEIGEYYFSHNLHPDSSCTPYLFYQVYDWLGTRYKYAGKSKKGIDCSGFVKEMYKNSYCIELQGGSKDIWPVTAPVEKENLIEGDMVFFKIKRGQISHVGIYLGNNKFAHASLNTGVTVNDLDEEYYKKYFFKGGRISYNTTENIK